MGLQKILRISKASFVIVLLFVFWGLIGVVFWPIKVTSFWGVGLGVAATLVFILCTYLKEFGLKKGFFTLLIITLVIIGATLLNQIRGWPFGFVTYHDILGWKVLGVAWPIPIFWSFFTSAALLIQKPKEVSNEPKILFSWAFDSAILVMAAALAVEPILTASTAEVWSMTGHFAGVPLNSFVGWFVSSFVACAVAILVGKLWQSTTFEKQKQFLPVLMLGFVLLGLMAAWRLDLILVQGLCVIGVGYFVSLLYKQRKEKRTQQDVQPNIVV